MVRDQELGLVQDRQLLLTLVALDDYLGAGRGMREPEAGPGPGGDGRGRWNSPGFCWGAARGSAAPLYSGRLQTAVGDEAGPRSSSRFRLASARGAAPTPPPQSPHPRSRRALRPGHRTGMRGGGPGPGPSLLPIPRVQLQPSLTSRS